MIALYVAGKPAPQGSKRHVGGGRMIESSKFVAPWRRTVAAAASKACPAPLDGPLAVSLAFVLPRPTSEPKRRTRPATRRPDVDKLARAVLDALTGPAFADDSQVVSLTATKRTAGPGEEPGCEIRVAPAEGLLAGYTPDELAAA